ncbi:hypothetical protein [Vulcanisaeta sp. JCM 14467]|uniref:hypothetical protein n=1 Tax=Vulcanisaeta sp. JCM 14467 TaxID=1295370 RepID=UPI002093E4E7|nr:hypothetical protein [Vulcanisaeta sp. JCM 14467]
MDLKDVDYGSLCLPGNDSSKPVLLAMTLVGTSQQTSLPCALTTPEPGGCDVRSASSLIVRLTSLEDLLKAQSLPRTPLTIALHLPVP